MISSATPCEAALRAVACTAAAILLLAGCAATGEPASAQPLQLVVTVVRAARAGISWATDRNGVFSVHIHDIGGTHHTLVWRVDSQLDPDDVRSFKDCMSVGQTRIAFSDPDGISDPRIYSSLVFQCARSSWMPASTDTPGQDASEYDIRLNAGRVKFPAGVALYSYGSNSLGANRTIEKSEVAAAAALADVRECASEANTRSKAVNSQLWSGEQAALPMTSFYVSIQPMLDAFDACLRARGYQVKIPEPPVHAGPS